MVRKWKQPFKLNDHKNFKFKLNAQFDQVSLNLDVPTQVVFITWSLHESDFQPFIP